MRPVIDIRNVHRIFESEAGCAHILHNVSLAVNPGADRLFCTVTSGMLEMDRC